MFPSLSLSQENLVTKLFFVCCFFNYLNISYSGQVVHLGNCAEMLKSPY